jgi:hypothetical protein
MKNVGGLSTSSDDVIEGFEPGLKKARPSEGGGAAGRARQSESYSSAVRTPVQARRR